MTETLMTKGELLKSILLPLADAYEGKKGPRTFTALSVEEHEPLRECIAELTAEGSVTDPFGMKAYHLTDAGYRKYQPSIVAWRTLPS
jgi:hypothetical protein